MLKLRLLTALILIPLVIAGIFYLPRPFFVWVTIIIFSMAAWEWARLSGWHKIWLKLLYTLSIILVMMATSHIAQGKILAIAVGGLWWSVVVLWLLKIRKAGKITALPQWSILLSGFIVIIPCWQAVLLLALEPALLFYMLLLIWVCDSAAYFGGRFWGKRKLAVAISPNKTFEGFYAGIAITALFSIAAAWFLSNPHELKLSWVLSALPLIVAAVTGDLFESALKRMQNVKDSGGLLPGHGGILDRLDSLMAAAPVFACAVIFIQQAGY